MDEDLLTTTTYADLDGDGFGDPGSRLAEGARSADRLTEATDCEDDDDTAYPGAPLFWDGGDHDSDGTTDTYVRFVYPDATVEDVTIAFTPRTPSLTVFDITSDGRLEICPGLGQTAVRVQAGNVTLRGGGPRATTLLGDGTLPVVELRTAGRTFVVEDPTLSGGQFGVRHAWRHTTDYADLTLRRAVVRGNENAQGFGAGIALRGDLVLEDVTLVANATSQSYPTSVEAHGAGAYVWGTLRATRLEATDNVVWTRGSGSTYNRGYGSGGALWSSGDMTLDDVTFSKNRLDVRAGGSSLMAEGAAAWPGGNLTGSGVDASGQTIVTVSVVATRFDARDCEWGVDALDNAVGDLRGQFVYDGVGESTFSCLAGTCRER